MGIELRNGTEQLGVLNIDSSQPDFFTEAHARNVTALSQQAVLALVYVRLCRQFYAEVAEREELQQALVRNLITTEMQYAIQELLLGSEHPSEVLLDMMEIMESALAGELLGLVVWDEVNGNLTHFWASDSAVTNTDLWHLYRQIVRQPDLEPHQMPSQPIAIPINGIVRLPDNLQALIGVINQFGLLFAIREGHHSAFNETEYELITTISRQTTVSLEKEALTNQLRQQTLQLSHLVEQQTEQIKVDQKRLRAILDATADGIFYMEDFQIQYANPAFCHMVGYFEEELRNKPLSMVRVLPEVNEKHNFEALFNNPIEIEPGRNETRLQHSDGTQFYASIRFSLVGAPGEHPVRMVAIARDVSQERKLYFQRARFVANAAHELRTPLSSLVLRLHMLKRQPEKMETHLESLNKVSDYLRELVEELLNLSRFERGMVSLDKDQFVLQTLIAQMVDENLAFAEAEGIEIRLQVPEEPLFAWVDGKHITMMIRNLIVNGINYTQAKGYVEIQLGVVEDERGNRNALLDIVDDGHGIDVALLPHEIFAPFARPSQGTRRETGMGLALVREIILLHGGTIDAYNRSLGGSHFRINLPIDR